MKIGDVTYQRDLTSLRYKLYLYFNNKTILISFMCTVD